MDISEFLTLLESDELIHISKSDVVEGLIISVEKISVEQILRAGVILSKTDIQCTYSNIVIKQNIKNLLTKVRQK